MLLSGTASGAMHLSQIVSVPYHVCHVGSEPHETQKRGKLLDVLSHVPNLLDIGRKVMPTDTFRVVMSERNAHLFHQAVDGTWKPVLRGGSGQIREHASLVSVGPDLLNVASNVVLAVAMAAVARKLAAIEAKVDQLGVTITNLQHGRLQGANAALTVTRGISDARERRSQMLNACLQLQVELLATTGLLKSHISAMPEGTTGRLQGLFGGGFKQAELQFEVVQEDVVVIGKAMAAMLEAYSDLEERAAAEAALTQTVSALQSAGLQSAVRKARLLPAKPGLPPPEGNLAHLAAATTTISDTLLGEDRATMLGVSLDFSPSELSHV